MRSRWSPILLSLAVALQAVLGSGVAICMGHDHQDEPAAHCECDHGAGAPVPIGDHDEECDCTDLDVASVDWPANTRTDVDAEAVFVAMRPHEMLVEIVVDHRPRPPQAEQAGRQRLVTVRTTRLNV